MTEPSESSEEVMAGGPKAIEIKGQFVHLQPNRVLKAASWGLGIAGLVMLAGLLTHVFPPGVIGFHLFLAGLVGQRFLARHNAWAKRVERSIRYGAEGVFVDGALAIPRSRISEGRFQPRPARNPKKSRSVGSTIRLFDKHGRILFEQEADEAQALEILRLLELDASRRRAEFKASSPLFATVKRNTAFILGLLGLTILLGALLGLVHLGSLAPLLVLVFFPPALVGMWKSRILVGSDGILLRWLWTKRFLPTSEIMSVTEVGDRAIDVTLRSWKVVRLYTSMARDRGPFVPQHRDAVLARIREALASHRAGTKVHVAALVGRSGRAAPEWLGALTRLRENHGYREGVVQDDDLWGVLEDPKASGDARAGAALALRPSLDAEGRARVRIAAEATASPKLRIALEAAAGESDEDAEKALSDIGADEVPTDRDAAAGWQGPR